MKPGRCGGSLPIRVASILLFRLPKVVARPFVIMDTITLGLRHKQHACKLRLLQHCQRGRMYADLCTGLGSGYGISVLDNSQLESTSNEIAVLSKDLQSVQSQNATKSSP